MARPGMGGSLPISSDPKIGHEWATRRRKCGRDGRIRTGDPLTPSQVRYPGCATSRFLAETLDYRLLLRADRVEPFLDAGAFSRALLTGIERTRGGAATGDVSRSSPGSE